MGYVPQEDMPYLYKLSSALVMPTLFESVSMPIWEAFSLGVPVVSSNVCALPEQVGDAGLLFDPYNIEDIAEKIFKLTDILPKKEDYGLTSQIRRAALSISANIAEAYGRDHTLDKINFYYFARGSVTETQNHLEYGKRVGYFDKDLVEKLDRRLLKLYSDLNKIVVTLKSSNK